MILFMVCQFSCIFYDFCELQDLKIVKIIVFIMDTLRHMFKLKCSWSWKSCVLSQTFNA